MAWPTLRSHHNVVFQGAFHVAWSPEYQRPALVPPADERLKTVLAEVVHAQGEWLQALELVPDHLHRLVEVAPQFGAHPLVKSMKGRAARVLRLEFPHLRSRLPTLWTNAYLVATTGGAPLAGIKRYGEHQEHV
jgi:putative transposase